MLRSSAMKLLILLAVVAACFAQDENQIDQCTRIECPNYIVLQRTPEYEVRRYSQSRWVSHSQKGMFYDDIRSSSFRKLFNYISGSNDQSQKVAMTAPVMTKVKPGTGPNCKSNFTMSFFVPRVHWGNIPNPSEQDVFLQDFSNTTVYVRAFTGYARDDEYLEEAGKLIQAINAPEKHSRFYYFVGYDSPYKWWDRRNEVWFIAN